MADRQRKRRVQRLREILRRLAGQRVHEIEVDVRNSGFKRVVYRPHGLRPRVHAAKQRKKPRLARLRAEGNAIHARASERAQFRRVHRAGVRFHADFRVRVQRKKARRAVQQPRKLIGRQQRRRPPADVQRGYAQISVFPARTLHLLKHARDIFVRVRKPSGIRFKIAIRALADAVRNVDIYGSNHISPS